MGPSGHRCGVLLRGIRPPLLADLLETLIGAYSGVELYREHAPPDVTVSLVIEGGDDESSGELARLVVSEDGAAKLVLDSGELSDSFLRLAVNFACRQSDSRTWLMALLEACNRIDDLLTDATDTATQIFNESGSFDDWRIAFSEGRTAVLGSPLQSPIASESESASAFEQALDRSQFLGPTLPGSRAVSELISEYGLTGRQIDILLLCLVHELDARYGRRYAYLQQDLNLQAPTVDLIAALLASDAAARLEIQQELVSGTLITSGLLTVGPAGLPQRQQVAGLDPTVLKILIGDDQPGPDLVVLDPRTTARADPGYQITPAAIAAVASINRGLAVHVHGGVPLERRSTALDIADALDQRLILASYQAVAQNAHWEIEHLRRECIRLSAICLIEGVPDHSEAWQAELGKIGPFAISSGSAPCRPNDGSPLRQRWNLRVEAPMPSERAGWWRTASDWTGVTVAGGSSSITHEHGVTIDRAAAALVAASNQVGSTVVTPEAVIAALAEATADDAGGLLHTTHPRVRLKDLIVSETTERGLRHALARIRNRDLVVREHGWDQRTSRLTGTYLLFAGPPGTGKTMAAEAMARELGLPVQYLEISSLFSRWVGEFEAAVDKVFAAAEASLALLVVNEADAILGPRTEVLYGQDRYANAGTSHILSRLEQFTGHVIFTSNLIGPSNIDPAFHRRLTATIRFLPPNEQQRRELWNVVWPTETRDGRAIEYQLPSSAVFDELARDHALSGGSIANIARTATFLAADEGGEQIIITQQHLHDALQMELSKIGDFRSLMISGAPS